MHYKSLCKVMVAAMSISLVVPNAAMAAEPATAAISESMTAAQTQMPETEPTEGKTQPSDTSEADTSSTEPVTPNQRPETEPPTETESTTGESDSNLGSESDTQTEKVTSTSEDTDDSRNDSEDDSESETESDSEDLHKQPQIFDSEKVTGDTDQTDSELNVDTEESNSGPDGGDTLNFNHQYTTNEDLVADQKLVTPPQILESFRFITVKKVRALSRQRKLKVYSEMDKDSKAVGKLTKNGLCFIIQNEDDGWTYIESGSVRGFVRTEDLITGKSADTYVEHRTEKALKKAKVLIDPLDNPAYTYTKTTTKETLVKKRYGIAKTQGLNVREGQSVESRIVGKLDQGALCYVLKDAKKEWVYVESGDVRGFIRNDLLIQGKEARKLVKEAGEETIILAEELIEPEDNKACFYTLTSTQEGAVSSSIRESMVRFAQQFVGNPYVWGGVSLTDGADCSGFVQSIYAQYGYTLPRVAEDQAQYGMKIPVEDAAPGDLIFYAKDGYIHHVVMYIGGGRTVEAQSTATGIVNADVSGTEAVWATRIISDEDLENVELVSNNSGQYEPASDSDIGQLLGTFKLTSYCSCPICCGKWSGGPTASGAMPIQGRTVAMAGVPFGTRLVINGQIYTVEDRGTPYGHVDVYMNNHQDAANFGVQYASVYMAN